MNDAIINAGFFLAGVITAVAVLFALADRRDSRGVPAEPVALPEPTPARVPLPVAVEAAVSEPAAPADVVFIERRPAPDLLPLPDPRPEEVPIFRQTPVRLPDYDSYSFKWRLPREPFPTGGFPVVVLSDDIEGYQVSEVPERQMDGFRVSAEDRKRLSIPEGLIEAAGLPSRTKAEVSA